MKIKNRIELAEYFNSLGFKIGAEIGVYKGYYSKILCQKIPGLKLYAIDNWGPRYEHSFETAKANLKPYGVTIIRRDSMEAAADFEDNSLDFVFIDARHTHKRVTEDIREWAKKVKKGGIVSGHDYYVFHHGSHGVIDAVNDYVKSHNFELNLTDWDRTSPIKDDRQPSWWFFKK